MQPSERVRVGGAEVFPLERKVLVDHRPVDLPWRCFEALLLLIEADSQVVERDVFFRRLWPDASVEESNLNQAIARLRRELGAAGELIETVPRRGYRLLIRPEPVVPDAPVLEPKKAAIGWWQVTAGVLAVSAIVLLVVLVWPKWSRHREAVGLVEEGFRLVRDSRAPKLSPAAALFSRALELDPQMALGYAGLAEVMVRSVDGSRMHARRMAERSLQLDPHCADCQAIAGWILLTTEWRFQDAQKYLESAAAARKNDARIQMWNAQSLACSGRLTQALEQIDHAIASNPTDASLHSMRAGILYFLQRFDDSIAAGRFALGLRPGDTGANDWIYRSAMAAGRIEEALSARSRLVANFNGLSVETQQTSERRWAAAYRAGGMKQLGTELLAESSGELAKKYQAYDRATLHLWMSDPQSALDDLQYIFEVHPYHAIYLGVDPAFAPLREDPRFRRILARVGVDKILVANN